MTRAGRMKERPDRPGNGKRIIVPPVFRILRIPECARRLPDPDSTKKCAMISGTQRETPGVLSPCRWLILPEKTGLLSGYPAGRLILQLSPVGAVWLCPAALRLSGFPAPSRVSGRIRAGTEASRTGRLGVLLFFTQGMITTLSRIRIRGVSRLTILIKPQGTGSTRDLPIPVNASRRGRSLPEGQMIRRRIP